MSKHTKGVGIDLGATAVRVVEVSGLDANAVAKITKCSIVPLRPGAIIGGKIYDHAGVAWAVSHALKELRISPYGVVLGISGTDTALTTLTVPTALTSDEQRKAIRVAKQEISPRVPLDKSSLSLNTMSEYDSEDSTTRTVLASVANHDALGDILQVAKMARLTPKAVDMSAAAVTRALTRSVPGNNEVATIVDVGASKITVATRQGLHLRSVRTLESGGENITRAIAGALSVPLDAAEEQKLLMRVSNEDSELVGGAAPEVAGHALYGSFDTSGAVFKEEVSEGQDALDTTATDLIEEIAAAVEADAANFPAAPTQGLLLCGGTSLLRGFRENLSRRIGVRAVIGRPWASAVPGRGVDQLVTDGKEIPEVLLSLATAIGLAIWKEAN